MNDTPTSERLQVARWFALGALAIAATVLGFKWLAFKELQITSERYTASQTHYSGDAADTEKLPAALQTTRSSEKLKPATTSPLTELHSNASATVPASLANNSAALDAYEELPPIDEIIHFRDVQKTLAAFSVLSASPIYAFLDGFGQETNRDRYASAVFRAGYQRLAEINFDDTLDAVLIKISSPGSDSTYWDNLALSVLSDQQPEYVASSIALVSATFNNPSAKQALDDLSISLDPAAIAQRALQQLQLSASDQNYHALLHTALSSWILKDPDSALDFVRSEISDEIQRLELTTDLLSQWLEHDPSAATLAVELVLNSQLSENPDAYLDLVDQYVAQKTKNDPEGALQWLDAQDNKFLRDSVINSVLEPWLEQDQAAALGYLARLDEQTAIEVVPLALSVVSNSLASDSASLENAINWSSQLPVSVRDNTRQRLVGAWIRNNPQRGVDWLVQQSYGGQSQDLVLPAAKALAREDAAAAARLHASLSGDLQLALTDTVILSLAKHGEDRALDWLNIQSDAEVVNRGRALVSQLFQ